MNRQTYGQPELGHNCKTILRATKANRKTDITISRLRQGQLELGHNCKTNSRETNRTDRYTDRQTH